MSKRLRKKFDVEWDSGHWSRFRFAELCRSEKESSISSCDIEENIADFQLIWHDIAVEVLRQFMGYISDSAPFSEVYASKTYGSIWTLARLDAFLATIIFYLRENQSDNVRGYCPKLYIDTFGSFLSIVYNQLTGFLAAYFKGWYSERLSVSFVSTSLLRFDVYTERESVKKLFVPSVNRRQIAVSSKWIWLIISEEIGEVCDPNII